MNHEFFIEFLKKKENFNFTIKKMEEVLHMFNAKLIASNKHKEITQRYKQLQTDEDRIKFTLDCMIEYSIIPKVIDTEKNAIESEKLREEGNKMFVTGVINGKKCVEVLKLYTKSIAYAPYPSKQLALAYANRSAVLFKMQKYTECIEDIERALKLEYPDDLKVKLYLRKIECLIASGEPSVEEAYNSAQYWLQNMSLNDVNREKLKVKLDDIYGRSKTSVKRVTRKPEDDNSLPTLTSQNPEIPCASDAVTIKYNNHLGRHVVATRKIHPGEVIAIEKPYSLLLIPEKLYTHCSNCLKVSWANIPCNYCTYAMYCSEKCKDVEWKKYHDIECRIIPRLVKLDYIPLDLFSIRLAIQAVREFNGFQKLRDEIKEIESCKDLRTKGFATDGKLYSNKYRGIYSLVTNTEKRPVSDLFRRSLDTCFILYYTATQSTMFGSVLDGNLSTLLKNDDVTFFGGLVLRHQQIIPTNMHHFSEEYNSTHAKRGSAAMPFISLINHSCDPNITRISTPEHIIVYAIYPIEKDEQIFDNYGQLYAMTPKKERQQKLLKQYYFQCNCTPCKEDWPLYYDLKSLDTFITDNREKVKIYLILAKLDEYIELTKNGKVHGKRDMIKNLLKMIEVLYDYVAFGPCQEMCNVVQTLIYLYDLSGNRFEIPTV